MSVTCAWCDEYDMPSRECPSCGRERTPKKEVPPMSEKMPDNDAALWSRGPVRKPLIPDELWTMRTGDGVLYRSRDGGPLLAWEGWPVPGLNAEWGTKYTRSDHFTALRDAAEAVVDTHEAVSEVPLGGALYDAREERDDAIDRLKSILSELPGRP